MKKDTLSDMVDNMAEDVAIVHQIPFASDRINNSTESNISPSSVNTTDPSSILRINGKMQCLNQTPKQQRRFVSTLEKVCILLI